MPNLYYQLWYSTGKFQALQLSVFAVFCCPRLILNGQQINTWNNTNQVLWCKMVSLGHNVLKHQAIIIYSAN